MPVTLEFLMESYDMSEVRASDLISYLNNRYLEAEVKELEKYIQTIESYIMVYGRG